MWARSDFSRCNNERTHVRCYNRGLRGHVATIKIHYPSTGRPCARPRRPQRCGFRKKAATQIPATVCGALLKRRHAGILVSGVAADVSPLHLKIARKIMSRFTSAATLLKAPEDSFPGCGEAVCL